MMFWFQVICLLVTLVTVFSYVVCDVYSKEHRLLPLFLGVLAVYDFYRIVFNWRSRCFRTIRKYVDSDIDDGYFLLYNGLFAYQNTSRASRGAISLSAPFIIGNVSIL